MENKLISLATIDDLSSDTVGQDILRYVSLPHFLGHEKDMLLYFMGRNLARKIEINTIDDVIYLFGKFKWGKLEIIKQKKNEIIFYLMADEIVKRLETSFETDFRLEAGFIAESMQVISGRPCECTETINERLYRIQFKLFYTD